jgi:hypothetical protein
MPWLMIAERARGVWALLGQVVVAEIVEAKPDKMHRHPPREGELHPFATFLFLALDDQLALVRGKWSTNRECYG